jgi:hypothetical protein
MMLAASAVGLMVHMYEMMLAASAVGLMVHMSGMMLAASAVGSFEAFDLPVWQ